MQRRNRTVTLTQFALLLALEAVVCFTPLGSLPALGPIVATLSHIPVVIAAIMLGPGGGALMGFFFGLFSFLVWTFTPPNPLAAFVFTPFYSLGDFQGNAWSLVICFVPRILLGLGTALLYKALSKRFPNNDVLGFGLSAFIGSLLHTLLVMDGIWLFFGRQYATLFSNTLLIVIGSTVLVSGIPEAILAAVVAYAVCKPLKKLFGPK